MKDFKLNTFYSNNMNPIVELNSTDLNFYKL